MHHPTPYVPGYPPNFQLSQPMYTGRVMAPTGLPSLSVPKQLTCYFWFNFGYCKKRESECLFAHHQTGRVAQPPPHFRNAEKGVQGPQGRKTRPSGLDGSSRKFQDVRTAPETEKERNMTQNLAWAEAAVRTARKILIEKRKEMVSKDYEGFKEAISGMDDAINALLEVEIASNHQEPAAEGS